tara:strand:- start:1599 stop:1823 length:225 start_codon:yes stop_codon:yes gene_type:complete
MGYKNFILTKKAIEFRAEPLQHDPLTLHFFATFIKKCNMEPARYKKFISRPDVMEALTNKDMNKLDHFIAGAKA